MAAERATGRPRRLEVGAGPAGRAGDMPQVTRDGRARGWDEACHIAKHVSDSGECARCGQVAQPWHIPMKRHGWFCAGCCPVCNGIERRAPGLMTGGAAALAGPQRAGHALNRATIVAACYTSPSLAPIDTSRKARYHLLEQNRL